MYIKFELSDIVDWTKKDGTKEIIWANNFVSKFFFESRIVPIDTVSEIITNDFGGEKYNVLVKKWHRFTCDLFMKESQFKLFSAIKFVRFAKVIDQFSNEYLIDTTSSDYIELSVEKVENSDSLKVVLTFRAELTEIDYQKTITLGFPTRLYFATSKVIDTDWILLNYSYEIKSNIVAIKQIIDRQESKDELNSVTYYDKIITKSGYLARFYLTDEQRFIVEKYLMCCDYVRFWNGNTNTEIVIIDKEIKQVEKIGANLNLIDINLIYEPTLFYPYAN